MSKTAVIFLHWKSLLNADVAPRELFVTQSRSYLDHLNPARGSLNELFRYQPIIFCRRENISDFVRDNSGIFIQSFPSLIAIRIREAEHFLVKIFAVNVVNVF